MFSIPRCLILVGLTALCASAEKWFAKFKVPNNNHGFQYHYYEVPEEFKILCTFPDDLFNRGNSVTRDNTNRFGRFQMTNILKNNIIKKLDQGGNPGLTINDIKTKYTTASTKHMEIREDWPNERHIELHLKMIVAEENTRRNEEVLRLCESGERWKMLRAITKKMTDEEFDELLRETYFPRLDQDKRDKLLGKFALRSFKQKSDTTGTCTSWTQQSAQRPTEKLTQQSPQKARQIKQLPLPQQADRTPRQTERHPQELAERSDPQELESASAPPSDAVDGTTIKSETASAPGAIATQQLTPPTGTTDSAADSTKSPLDSAATRISNSAAERKQRNKIVNCISKSLFSMFSNVKPRPAQVA